MKDIYYPSHDGLTTVHACLWLPEGEIKGVVQIIHGMCEYASRYSSFAEFLNKHGYAVCAEDHLGHGQSVKSKDDLGFFTVGRDNNVIIRDIRALQLAVKKQVGDKPYFILGHSMGSFFCRKYISLYGEDFNGAVIMGTGYKNKFTLYAALFMVRLNSVFYGWRNRSPFIKKLAFGNYNKKFSPARTENDWLSVNAENVDKYNADELCNFSFTNNGYYGLFSVINDACSHKTIKAVPETLPVYFVAGAEDPVGDYGKGVQKTYDKFLKAGVKDVNITLYEGARHEILNDDCKEEVCNDILTFLEAHPVIVKPQSIEEAKDIKEEVTEGATEKAPAEEEAVGTEENAAE